LQNSVSPPVGERTLLDSTDIQIGFWCIVPSMCQKSELPILIDG
jgi:hypothetical protein